MHAASSWPHNSLPLVLIINTHHVVIYMYIYLKNFVWEDQRENEYYICHIAQEIRLECYIVTTYSIAWYDVKNVL